MKSKYYVLENRQPLFFTNKSEAGKVSSNYRKIPDGMTAFHLEHGYPDTTRISFYLEVYDRMESIIKEIP